VTQFSISIHPLTYIFHVGPNFLKQFWKRRKRSATAITIFSFPSFNLFILYYMRNDNWFAELDFNGFFFFFIITITVFLTYRSNSNIIIYNFIIIKFIFIKI